MVKAFQARCCYCLCPSAFDIIGTDFTWLGNVYNHDFPEGDRRVDCSRTSDLCFSDEFWQEIHEEEVGNRAQPIVYLGFWNDCGCPGYVGTRAMSVWLTDALNLKFKLWHKLRYGTRLIVEECGTNQVRFRLKATIEALWPWNVLQVVTRQLAVTEFDCNLNITSGYVVSGPEPAIPEVPFPQPPYPALYGCEEGESWEQNNCGEMTQLAPPTLTPPACPGNSPVINALIGRIFLCNDCPSIGNPSNNRLLRIAKEYEYVSECFNCNDIPEEVTVQIPGWTSNPIFNTAIYDFGLGSLSFSFCPWLDNPSSWDDDLNQEISIPYQLTLTVRR